DLDAAEAALGVATDLLGQGLGVFAPGVEARGGVDREALAVAPEEAVERGARGLADDIPEGDVHAADRHHKHAAAAPLLGADGHHLPELFNPEGVLAED